MLTVDDGKPMKPKDPVRVSQLHLLPDLAYTFFVNQTLALIITLILIVFSGMGWSRFLGIFIPALVFSNIIGFLVCILFQLEGKFHWRQHLTSKFAKTLLVGALILTAVIIGTAGSLLLLNHIPGYKLNITSRYIFYFFVANLVICSLVVALILLYDKLKSDLQKKIEENEKIKHLQIQTKLEAIQAKINPHFLFNTLNTILDMVYKDPKKVEQMILNLSDIYRKILTWPEDQRISLEEEIELVKKYLEIEKYRMEDRLCYHIYIDKTLAAFKIPPLLIEPLVENAVIHGIAPKPKGGVIDIEITDKMESILIKIEDTGVGFKSYPTSNGFGLFSIQSRLQMIYKSRASIHVDLLSPVGTRIVMEIPHEG